MEQDNKFQKNGIYSKRVRAGRRRTYFFDVRTTRSNDYYLTITESKRRFEGEGYERHKLHLYKEDFNKFLDGLQHTIDYVKTELMPEYDFDEYTRDDDDGYYNNNNNNNENNNTAVNNDSSSSVSDSNDDSDADGDTWD
ncbi:MAG: DUF3276 family protein [Chitinophagales bacterium]